MNAFLALVLLTAQVDVKNATCKDPERAPILCDAAYELFDTGQVLERRLESCNAKLYTAEKKLEIRTATATVHYVERDASTSWLIPTLVGVVGVVLGVVVGSQL